MINVDLHDESPRMEYLPSIRITPEIRARLNAAVERENERQSIGKVRLSDVVRAAVLKYLDEESDQIVKRVPGYHAVHSRARKALPQECAMTDETCVGHLEVAFKHDAPTEFVRVASGAPVLRRPKCVRRLHAPL